jgi:hypothetical protein
LFRRPKLTLSCSAEGKERRKEGRKEGRKEDYYVTGSKIGCRRPGCGLSEGTHPKIVYNDSIETLQDACIFMHGPQA